MPGLDFALAAVTALTVTDHSVPLGADLVGTGQQATVAVGWLEHRRFHQLVRLVHRFLVSATLTAAASARRLTTGLSAYWRKHHYLGCSDRDQQHC